MINLVKENREKINRFDIDFYSKEKNYQIVSALAALKTTNDIQLSFLKEEKGLDKKDYALRLYALMQALFVSIDSLYAIAYGLTKSRSFININANPDLRLLKYIRNDVVGHPANRIVSDDVSFCVLDDNSITKEEFNYYIYSKDNVEKKTVKINDILKSYCEEANNLLDNLYEIATKNKVDNIYEGLIEKIINDYMNDRDYHNNLNKLIEAYKEIYPNAKRGQHRLLWRYDVINKLSSYKCKNQNEKELVNYCIGIELFKLYELVNNIEYNITMNKKNPKYVSSLFRMLNKNNGLSFLIDNLKETDHPLFYSSLNRLLNEAIRLDNIYVRDYLKMIKKAYNNGQEEIVFGLSLPFRQYIRK